MRKRIEEKQAAGAKVSKWTKSLRRRKLAKFIDFVARRSEKQHYREHKSYFREFVKFLDAEFHPDVTVDELTAEHFRKYRDHVRAGARRSKKVTNKDIWMNRRLGAVTTAFRRVKKEYDLAWSQGIFGEDGNLAILEQRTLLERNPQLARSISNRFPYIDPLNHVQLELLRRYRGGDTDDRVVQGIHLTINGIAAGLRNSG